MLFLWRNILIPIKYNDIRSRANHILIVKDWRETIVGIYGPVLPEELIPTVMDILIHHHNTELTPEEVLIALKAQRIDSFRSQHFYFGSGLRYCRGGRHSITAEITNVLDEAEILSISNMHEHWSSLMAFRKKNAPRMEGDEYEI